MDNPQYYVDLIAGPSAGIGMFGIHNEPLRPRIFFDLVCELDKYHGEYNTNSLIILPYENSHDPRAKWISRFRRGKSWDTIFKKLEDLPSAVISMTNIPGSKHAALDLLGVDINTCRLKSIPISHLAHSSVYNRNVKCCTIDYRDILNIISRYLIKNYDYKYGYIQLFQKHCLHQIMPSEKATLRLSRYFDTPLISIIEQSRYDGEISRYESREWNYEPFNLYWANIIHKSIADKCDITQFLRDEISLKYVEITDEIPHIACVGRIFEDYLYFCLSDNIEDALNPNKEYVRKYKKILNYMMDKDIIYPGITPLYLRNPTSPDEGPIVMS